MIATIAIAFATMFAKTLGFIAGMVVAFWAGDIILTERGEV